MRAALFEGPGRLSVRDVPPAVCPDGGALLTVAACAVCGTDARIFRFGHAKITPPQVLGHEVVGTITESRSSEVQVGARVTVAPAVGCGTCRWCRVGRPNRCADLRTIGYQWPGAFAQQLAVPAEAVRQGSVCLVPDGLSDELACLAEPLACCLNGQQLVHLEKDDRVVILGAGPIGCLHARLAWAQGAAQVVIVESRPERCEQARQLGLGQVVQAGDGAREAVLELTDGGADVALVAASSPALYREVFDLVAKGGRISLFAGLPPQETLTPLPANRVHYEELTVAGAHGSTPTQNRATLALLATGRVRADDLVTGRWTLEQTGAAVAATAAGDGLKNVVNLLRE